MGPPVSSSPLLSSPSSQGNFIIIVIITVLYCTVSLLYSIAKSVETFFRDRSPISILNWVGQSALSDVTDHLSQVLPSQSLHTNTNTTPLLHFNVAMAPGTCLSLQLLQFSSSVSIKCPPDDTNKLTVIHPHYSLLTAYLSGLAANFLVLSSSEMQGPATKKEGQSSVEGPQSAAVHSIKVSAEVKCPVLQANLSVLVDNEAASDNLPGLVPAQQQVDFHLIPPKPAPDRDGQGPMVNCDLLEAGIKNASVSFAAHIFRSKTSQEPLVTWDSLGSTTANDPLQPVPTEGHKMQTNHMYVGISLPVLWSQLASPQCGLPDPTAGGLDILLLHDAIQAWDHPLQQLKESLLTLIKTKRAREKRVMLTLLSNAIQTSLHLEKSFNPVLAELSDQCRRTVAFSCLHQIWRSLTVFSEIHVPALSHSSEEKESNMQLVGLTLALASRLYPVQVLKIVAEELSSPVAVRESDQTSLATEGYVSISPSPSDMAMPNRLYAASQQLDQPTDMAVFSQVDYGVLAALREALLPVFSAMGVTLERQYQMPHLNKAEFSIDFTLELREATLFVLDHVQAKVSVPSSTPTLLAEQLLIHGCVKHYSELETASSVPKVSLLLPDADALQQNGSQAKASITSNCSASMETIHVIITAPLLKLSKHISVTGKLRRKALKQAQLDRMDKVLTPHPSSPAVESTGYVSKISTSIVSHLAGLQGTTVPSFNIKSDTLPSVSIHGDGGGGGGSFHHVKLMEYVDSPRPASNVKRVSPSPAPLTRGARETFPGEVKVGKGYPQQFCSSSSDQELPRSVTIAMEEGPGTSPEEVVSTVDTCGEDTTDSQHVVSSDNEPQGSFLHSDHRSSSHETSGLFSSHDYLSGEHAQSLLVGLSLPESELQYSVLGLLKLATVKCELQVESTRASLELVGISAAVDTRNSTSSMAPDNATNLFLLSQVLPTYLSIAATLKKAVLRISDRGLPESDLLQLTVLPMVASIGVSNLPATIPSYRALLKLTSLQIDIKQSAVKVHKRFQQLMPAFTRIYRDIFGQEVEVLHKSDISTPSPSAQQLLSVESVIKLPAKLPQGFIHFSLDRTQVYVAPLPSLSVTYTVSLVLAKFYQLD